MFQWYQFNTNTNDFFLPFFVRRRYRGTSNVAEIARDILWDGSEGEVLLRDFADVMQMYFYFGSFFILYLFVRLCEFRMVRVHANWVRIIFNRRLVDSFISPPNSNSRSGDTPHAHNRELGTQRVLIIYLALLHYIKHIPFIAYPSLHSPSFPHPTLNSLQRFFSFLFCLFGET